MSDDHPIALVTQWLEEAGLSEPNEPAAMSVATVSRDGRPSLRMVLLRGIDERGFVFYTNLTSRKSVELLHNPAVALCLHWKSLARQVRIEGRAELVTDTEADAYFASRERESQIGAWASKQSAILDARTTLEHRVAEYSARFAGQEIPRPAFWSGFRVAPSSIEFWEQRPFRLHERIVFELSDEQWRRHVLYP
jgi:pyridoxamine 5'-phosphate oxidase